MTNKHAALSKTKGYNGDVTLMVSVCACNKQGHVDVQTSANRGEGKTMTAIKREPNVKLDITAGSGEFFQIKTNSSAPFTPAALYNSRLMQILQTYRWWYRDLITTSLTFSA